MKSYLIIILLPLLSTNSSIGQSKLLNSVEIQIGVTTIYDPSYYRLEYPGGDIDRERGVCIDVIIRGLRDAYNYDLQEVTYDFMKENSNLFSDNPDRNIAHRRVRNILILFRNIDAIKEVSIKESRPGDIIAWDLGGGVLHIGIMANQNGQIIHNISSGVVEEQSSSYWKELGRFRFVE